MLSLLCSSTLHFIFTDLQHVSNPPGLVSGAVSGGSPVASGSGHFCTDGAVSDGMLVSGGSPAAGGGGHFHTGTEPKALFEEGFIHVSSFS